MSIYDTCNNEHRNADLLRQYKEKEQTTKHTL